MDCLNAMLAKSCFMMDVDVGVHLVLYSNKWCNRELNGLGNSYGECIIFKQCCPGI